MNHIMTNLVKIPCFNQKILNNFQSNCTNDILCGAVDTGCCHCLIIGAADDEITVLGGGTGAGTIVDG